MPSVLARECPHLGVPGDKKSLYSYPNILNVCYADRSAWSEFQPVDLAHQRQFCLSQNQLLCPIYLLQSADVQRTGRQRKSQTFLEFFGLHEEPFSIVPQSRYLCESRSQKQAHAGLKWLISQHQGLGVLTGAIGTGKTLLCRTLAEELSSDPGHVTALLLTPNPRSEYAFLTDLLDCWKVTPARRRSLRDLEAAAHHFLVGTVLSRRQTAVLIVDEAHTLSRRVLQEVCKLLNWQDGGVQLLQVILAGQPSLQRQLRRVPALRDRVVVEFTLTAMTLAEMQTMISGRLRRAGHRGNLFAPSAIQLIHQCSGGMPRRVMILCLLSLWLAYQQGQRQIFQEQVRAVAERAGSSDLSVVWEQEGEPVTADWSQGASQPSPVWLPRFVSRFLARVSR
jgi:type II secretory pathway predicted ATPase ExeA